jgi:hypothetical protein
MEIVEMVWVEGRRVERDILGRDEGRTSLSYSGWGDPTIPTGTEMDELDDIYLGEGWEHGRGGGRGGAVDPWAGVSQDTLVAGLPSTEPTLVHKNYFKGSEGVPDYMGGVVEPEDWKRVDNFVNHWRTTHDSSDMQYDIDEDTGEATENPVFKAVVTEMDADREFFRDKQDWPHIRLLMRNCPVGWGFNVFGWSGLTLGEVATNIALYFGGGGGGAEPSKNRFLRNWFLSCDIWVLRITYEDSGQVVDPTALVPEHKKRVKGVSFGESKVWTFPMWRIHQITSNFFQTHEEDPKFGDAGEGWTLEEKIDALKQFITTEEFLEDLLNQEVGGSDLKAVFVYKTCKLMRRFYDDQYNAIDAEVDAWDEYQGDHVQGRHMMTRDIVRDDPELPNNHVLRTAGFGEVLTETAVAGILSYGFWKGELIVPGGIRNCVDQCIVEVLIRRGKGEGEAERMRQSVEDRVVTEMYERGMSGNGKRRAEDFYRKKYHNQIAVGYSGRELLRVKRVWWELHGVLVRVFYEYNRKRGEGVRMGDVYEVGGSDVPEGRPNHNVVILRMYDDGTLYVRNENQGGEMKDYVEDESVNVGKILHAITFYPPFSGNAYKSHIEMRREVKKKIERMTIPFMKERRDFSALRKVSAEVRGDLFERVGDLGEYQKLRWKEKRVGNLFYKEGEEEEGSGERGGGGRGRGGGGGRKWEFRPQKKDRPLVVAYDIETVELTAEAMLAGKVDLSLIGGYSREAVEAGYITDESQIPYSIQWVPINLSDEGEHKARKVAKGGFVLSYEWLGPPTKGERFEWVTMGNKRVRTDWVMLDTVKVEYGKRELLGECVHDFIERVAEYALESELCGGVYCYAHNGSGFDSYIILKYNTKYTIAKRLKTSRGVLSLTLEYPYVDHSAGGKEKILMVHFLDTKLFLNFSLHKICKDFKVPAEWSKLDFPITRVNWKNCYDPEVKEVAEPYGINDVKSLACIVKMLNRMLTFQKGEVLIAGQEEYVVVPHHPPSQSEEGAAEKVMTSLTAVSTTQLKPPVLQFVTFMSFVKKMLNSYFHSAGIPKPISLDVSVLRGWVKRASMGGRVSAYARGYVCKYWGEYVRAYLNQDVDAARGVMQKVREEREGRVVLDITSLYPVALAECPMPNGEMYNLSSEQECSELVRAVGCERCEAIMELCPSHKGVGGRDFGIVLVRGVRMGEEGKRGLRPYCGRRAPLLKEKGLQYTLEDRGEMGKRLRDGMKRSWEEMDEEGEEVSCEVEAYTNVDFYWMLKAGFVFEKYVGGFAWKSGDAFRNFIEGGFAMRVKSKREGNQCLQLTLKLMLNGSFGVHSQRDVVEKEVIAKIPEELRHLHHTDKRIVEYVCKHHIGALDPRFKITDVKYFENGQAGITGKMKEDFGESLTGYSPNHVGAAVLAWSRHIMNLCMFAIDGDCIYTDTDSLCVSSSVYQWMCENTALIDESGKKLGTYKNDHGEGFSPGEDPRILFSAIGAKKVKMHCVVGKSGELRLFNTYKGFLQQGVCPKTGKKYSADRLSYQQSKALLEIFYNGSPEARRAQRWSRSEEVGVRIEKDVAVSCDSGTYLGYCKAFTSCPDGPTGESRVFRVVPHGSTYAETPLITPVRKEMIGMGGKIVSYSLPPEWDRELEEHMGGIDMDTSLFMLKRYYPQWNRYYLPEGEEERKEYQAVQSVFE